MDLDQNLELVTRPTHSTQFYLFNLFADYIVPRGGRIWTNDLLYLLNLLGVGERAARSTLSRMKKRGWLVPQKHGRQSQYSLTERGQAVLEEGDKRIFENPLTDWDGAWRLVVYSLPEEKRKLRNELRKKLIWFGFGNLAPGTWISPHDRHPEVRAILTKLGVLEHVMLFTGSTVANLEIVQRCWAISELQAEYEAFIQRHQPAYEALLAQFTDGEPGTLTPEACFVTRFWLTYDFQRFPRKDPNLPVVLLPEDWAGFKARRLFMDYRQLLSQGMGRFMDTIVYGSDA
ncbi:MAG: PaaX family transcriptional regulator C-terminal domain-containing protein [Anaerolineae bacterium]